LDASKGFRAEQINGFHWDADLGVPVKELCRRRDG